MTGVQTCALPIYDTSSSLAETAAFYEEQIPSLGWELIGQPAFTETSAYLDFQNGDQNLTVTITANAGVTTVNILLERIKE